MVGSTTRHDTGFCRSRKPRVAQREGVAGAGFAVRSTGTPGSKEASSQKWHQSLSGPKTSGSSAGGRIQ
eukprot:6112979-Prorocentrum_lima.AAC.1